MGKRSRLSPRSGTRLAVDATGSLQPSLTEGQLAALYERCNRTRFGGRLPTARVEWREPPDGLAGSTRLLSALGPSIWLHPILASVMGVRRVLLHEMCHLEAAGEPGHGPEWRAAMLRLQQQGERWVPADLANMAAAEAETDALLKAIFSAMDKLDRSVPFHEVSALLVRRFRNRRGPRFETSAATLINRDMRVFQRWMDRGGRLQ